MKAKILRTKSAARLLPIARPSKQNMSNRSFLILATILDCAMCSDSISQPGHWYEVDLRAYTCTCLDYPAICFCKHIHAVQTHFPSLQPLENLPQAAVKSDSLSTASRPTGLALLSGMSKFVYLIKNSRLIFSKKLTAKALVPYLLLYRVRTTIQVYYKMFPRSLSTLQLNSDFTEPLSKPCGLACGLTRNLGIQ